MPTATEIAIESALKLRNEAKELHYNIDDVTNEIRAFHRREDEQGYDGDEDIVGNLQKKWQGYVTKQTETYKKLHELEKKHNLTWDGDSYEYGDDVCE